MFNKLFKNLTNKSSTNSSPHSNQNHSPPINSLLQNSHNADTMQQTSSQHSHRSSSPIFNLLQDQNLMLLNDANDANEEEKKQEDDEKQDAILTHNNNNNNAITNDNETLSAEEDDDDNNENNAEEDIVLIDEEKTSEPKPSSNQLQSGTNDVAPREEIPEDEKQSPSNTIRVDETHDSNIKQIEDQKVNNSMHNDDDNDNNNNNNNDDNEQIEHESPNNNNETKNNDMQKEIEHEPNDKLSRKTNQNELQNTPKPAQKAKQEKKNNTNKIGANLSDNQLFGSQMSHKERVKEKEKQRTRERRKFPREMNLNRVHFNQYKAILNIDTNDSKTAVINDEKNKRTSLLLFMNDKLDDHVLDRYNYHTFAITAQLIAYPLSYNASELRVIDRFYHRYAHHFHFAYLNQLKKQTFHATKEQIADETFYNAIGGKDVSRRSLIIPSDGSSNNNNNSWIDLDGSQLVPSAIAGIQTNGIASVFFIRIPDNAEEQLVMKVHCKIDTLCHDALYSSIRWHPTSAHTLLIMDKNVIKLFQIDRDFHSTTNVLTLNMDLSRSVREKVSNMIISYHYSFDSYLLMTLNGPQNKSYGLISAKDTQWNREKYESELDEINFINIYKFKKFEASDPRRINAKHLDDITDYDSCPILIAHLDHDTLQESVKEFDARNGNKTESLELFQHCVMIQPFLENASKSQLLQQQPQSNSYFFATVSKCIGESVSFVTLWALIRNETDLVMNNNKRVYTTKCLQRLRINASSINTLITSMEYNRYSRPYIILTSTSFDPFESNYMEQRRKYIEDKVLNREQKQTSKVFKTRFQESSSKPIIYVDFKQVQSHIISLDWFHNEILSQMVPFVNCVLSKTDPSPCSQLIPCRSLYRFVESSLIKKQSELKNLKLYTRRATIGLLQIGVFGFQYLELYTQESIKLRRSNIIKAVHVNNHDTTMNANAQQQLAQQLRNNTQVLKQRTRDSTKKDLMDNNNNGTATSNYAMASYLYSSSNNSNSITSNVIDESAAADCIIDDNNKIKASSRKKKSEQQFYSRLDKMLSQHHATFLNNLDKKMSEKLQETQKIMRDKLGEFEQQQRKYENEMFETVHNNTTAVESLTNKWNTNPPLNLQDMEQVLSQIIADKIMPKFGVYMMTMFKNFCNNWIVPSVNNGIEKAVIDTNKLITKEVEHKLKTIRSSLNEIEEKRSDVRASNLKITKSSENRTKYTNKTRSEPISAMLSDQANVQIANLVNKQLQDTLKLLNQSLSNIIQKQLQKSLAQIQRELNSANSTISTSFQNQINDSMQQQFKNIVSELKHVQASQAGLSSMVQSNMQSMKYNSYKDHIHSHHAHAHAPHHSRNERRDFYNINSSPPPLKYDSYYNPHQGYEASQLNDKLAALQQQLDKLTANQTQHHRSQSSHYGQRPHHHAHAPSPYYANASDPFYNSSNLRTMYYERERERGNDNNLYNELQGKITELMSEYQQKMKPCDDLSRRSMNDNNNKKQEIAAAASSSSSSASLISQVSTEHIKKNKKEEEIKRRQECLLLMQQFCDSNQPFHAIDAMMKYKNYDFVIDLFDKYDVETLFKKDKSSNVSNVMTFDLMNQLIWLLADFMISNDVQYSNDTSKFIEWMSIILENINVKHIDFNMNSLQNTLSKIENNLKRISQRKLQIKQVSRSIKYLKLLIEKWKSHTGA